MKRIKYRLVALLLVLVTIFANIQPALALEDYEVNLGVDILSAWNNWTPISAYSGGTMQYPGQWSYNSNGYIVNAENTYNMTGFYNPTTNYSDMDISISMGSWDVDDDTLGAMIRFSEDKDHNCTGYVFAYDSADVNGGWFRGLYKINGKQFAVENLEKVVDLPTTHWQRGNYETIRISAQGNNIKVWRNNTLIVNYTDPNPIEAGSYGFMSASQPDARFKGITGKATLAHFTASFDANDGTLSGNESKIVTSTKTYGTLPTATRKGYIFDGWYDAKTGGNKITSTDAVGISSDTTFYAHWTPIESTINFDANSGTVSTASKKVYYEQKIGEMPTPTKTGYTFAGWCTDKDGKGGYITSDYEIAWDTSRTATLYAQWTINKYKNKYEHWAWGFTNSEGNNGSKNALLMQTTYGEEIYGEEFTPNASYGLTVPNGFFLAQRFGNGQITGKWQTFNFGTKLTQPNYVMNFEYDYFPTNYTITYNLNGGTNNSNNPSTYNVLYGVTFSNPTKAGYDFAGWYDANGNKITGINEGCNATFSDTADLYSKLKTRKTGNVSITAKWTPINYTISYNLNGGTVNNKISYTIETEKFTLNAPTKKGYTFLGWTGSNGTNLSLTVTIPKGSTGNKSYKAHWRANKLIVTYNKNGGIIDKTMNNYSQDINGFSQEWQYNHVNANGGTTEDPINFSSFGLKRRDGYVRRDGAEWNTKPDGTGRSYDQDKSYTMTQFAPELEKGDVNLVLYAQWQPAEYSITYDLKGGSLSNQKTSYNVETATFTLPQPTKKGYRFLGWTGSNGTTAQKSVSIDKGTTGNKSYTANWTPINYTITYNLDGGTANNKTSYNIETATFTLSNPTKNGYVFVGWTGSNGTTPQKTVSIAKGSTGNKSYTAVFEKIIYTITTSKVGSGALSDSSKVEYDDGTSVFIIPAEGYTTSSLKIDGVSVNPTSKYNFLNINKNHKVEATFTISQSRKMELMQKGYKWIDLKL